MTTLYVTHAQIYNIQNIIKSKSLSVLKEIRDYQDHGVYAKYYLIVSIILYPNTLFSISVQNKST